MENQKDKISKKIILTTTITLLILLAGLILSFIFFLKPMDASSPIADLTLLPGMTNTPILPTNTPTIIPSPTIGIRPSPLPGTIGIGGYVQVFGTNGGGLNIRSSIGISATLVFNALDGELFVIVDGPKTQDGYTWWKIQSSVESSRTGWAVDNYLAPINP